MDPLACKDILNYMLRYCFDKNRLRDLRLVNRLWHGAILEILHSIRELGVRACSGKSYYAASRIKDIYFEYPVCVDCFMKDNKLDQETVLSWVEKGLFTLEDMNAFVQTNVSAEYTWHKSMVGGEKHFNVFCTTNIGKGIFNHTIDLE